MCNLSKQHKQHTHTYFQATKISVEYLDTSCSSVVTSRTLADIRDDEVRQECQQEQGNSTMEVREVARVTVGNSCDYPSSQVESVTTHWDWTTILAGVRWDFLRIFLRFKVLFKLRAFVCLVKYSCR